MVPWVGKLGLEADRGSVSDSFATWVRWQGPYVAFASTYFPVTLAKRAVLKQKRAQVGLDPLAARFRDKWGFVSAAVREGSGGGDPIWINMNSGGEVVQSLGLLQQLGAERGGYVLTTESYDSFELLRRRYGRRVFFPPWDLAVSASRALARVRPRALVYVQNAVFPVLLRRARRSGAKTLLVSGLLSRNVERGDRAIQRALALGYYHELDALAVQGEEDADAYRRLGVPAGRITITGDLARDLSAARLDAAARARLRAGLGFEPDETVFIVASTHAAESETIIEILQAMRRALPRVRFIVAPRHLHEAGLFGDACRTAGFSTVTRTVLLAGADAGTGHDVLLLDSFGELRAIYAAADVAFIGSSLVRLNERGGGHNPLEALVQGTIPLFGPHMNLWPGVAAALRDVWPGSFVESPAAVARSAAAILEGGAPVAALRGLGERFIQESGGAIDRTVAFLRRELDLA